MSDEEAMNRASAKWRTAELDLVREIEHHKSESSRLDTLLTTHRRNKEGWISSTAAYLKGLS